MAHDLFTPGVRHRRTIEEKVGFGHGGEQGDRLDNLNMRFCGTASRDPKIRRGFPKVSFCFTCRFI
jgi:hypothetical protein